ncbi:MAG: hypothetical protein NTNFB01_22140 [Nitrospira sp.]
MSTPNFDERTRVDDEARRTTQVAKLSASAVVLKAAAWKERATTGTGPVAIHCRETTIGGVIPLPE